MSSYILFPTAAIPKIYYSNTSKVDSILIKEALITLQKRNVSTFFFLDCTLFAVLHSFFINNVQQGFLTFVRTTKKISTTELCKNMQFIRNTTLK